VNVIVACEFSQVVTQEFLKLGHNAYSCDLLPTEGDPGRHHQGDVFEVLKSTGPWDLMIAHPPCTYLCNSGVRWLHERPGRMDLMRQGAEFFRDLIDYKDIPSVVGENPIPHKYAIAIIGRKYDQTIQPWQFGHGETKRTCLWLRNTPPLMPTKIVSGRVPKVHHASPGPNRWAERSRTYKGIAEAMAAQWGKAS
jgi:hypothetical protein